MPCAIDQTVEICGRYVQTCYGCPHWDDTPDSETQVCVNCGVIWKIKEINPENHQCLYCDGEVLER